MARMRQASGMRKSGGWFWGEDPLKHCDPWQQSNQQLQQWQHQLQHYPRAQQEVQHRHQQQQEQTYCSEQALVHLGSTAYTAASPVGKKEIRAAMDTLWYTVDHFTSFYGTRKGLMYWSWTYYYQDDRSVEVERIGSDGVRVTLLKDEVSDEE